MSTPEDVAALHQEATLVADGLRTLMWSYHYKGEERTYSGLIDRQRATIERLERERDEAKAISQGWELQAGEAEAEAREVVESAEKLIPQLEKATATFGWPGTSEAAALIRELLSDRRWQPIETASIGVRYLVRGWGEGNRQRVFEFATKDKSVACIKWNMGRGDKLWFEPTEYMDLASLGVSPASAKTAEDRGNG